MPAPSSHREKTAAHALAVSSSDGRRSVTRSSSVSACYIDIDVGSGTTPKRSPELPRQAIRRRTTAPSLPPASSWHRPIEIGRCPFNRMARRDLRKRSLQNTRSEAVERLLPLRGESPVRPSAQQLLSAPPPDRGWASGGPQRAFYPLQAVCVGPLRTALSSSRISTSRVSAAGRGAGAFFAAKRVKGRTTMK